MRTLIIFLLLTPCVYGAPFDPPQKVKKSLVKFNFGCTGVAIDQNKILTIKHCDPPPTAIAKFPYSDIEIKCERIFITDKEEGTVIYESKNPVPAFRSVGPPPARGDPVYGIGFPGANDSNITISKGEYKGKKPVYDKYHKIGNFYSVNFASLKGMSGGPLFNMNHEVIGLLSQSNWQKGYSLYSVLESYGLDQEQKQKKVLYALVSPYCPPCEKFKRDVQSGAFGNLKIKYIQAGSRKARQLFPGIRSTPAFRIDGKIMIGYSNARNLLEFVATTLKVTFRILQGMLNLIAGEPKVPDNIKDHVVKLEQKLLDLKERYRILESKVQDPKRFNKIENYVLGLKEDLKAIKEEGPVEKVKAALDVKKKLKKAQEFDYKNPMELLALLGTVGGWIARKRYA